MNFSKTFIWKNMVALKLRVDGVEFLRVNRGNPFFTSVSGKTSRPIEKSYIAKL